MIYERNKPDWLDQSRLDVLVVEVSRQLGIFPIEEKLPNEDNALLGVTATVNTVWIEFENPLTPAQLTALDALLINGPTPIVGMATAKPLTVTRLVRILKALSVDIAWDGTTLSLNKTLTNTQKNVLRDALFS